MSMQKIIIGKNEAGQRLDRFLRKFLGRASLGQIYSMIRKDVKVDGRRARPEYMLKEGEEISLYISDQDVAEFSKKKRHYGSKKQFKVIYEDDDIIAVAKPAGLIVHGDAKEKKNTLTNQVIGYLVDKGDYEPKKELSFTPAPANRLDRNTSGVVVFGKTASSLQELNRLFRSDDEVERIYLALVHGRLDGILEIDSALAKRSDKNIVEVASSETGNSQWQKNAKTSVKSIISNDYYSLVEVRLHTGRTHQIRVHLASSGHPIVGDPKYGKADEPSFTEREFGMRGQMLHALRLKIDGRTVEAPLPPKWEKILRKCFGSKAKYIISSI